MGYIIILGIIIFVVWLGALILFPPKIDNEDIYAEDSEYHEIKEADPKN